MDEADEGPASDRIVSCRNGMKRRVSQITLYHLKLGFILNALPSLCSSFNYRIHTTVSCTKVVTFDCTYIIVRTRILNSMRRGKKEMG
jgi:hypothetical protein